MKKIKIIFISICCILCVCSCKNNKNGNLSYKDEKQIEEKIKINLENISKETDLTSSNPFDYTKNEYYQNKLHYAITGNTAAEIIYNRVDSEKENMGLTNWKNSPDGPNYKYDVDIAKNYLNEKKLKDLNRIVTMYLDYAELQAENHNAMTMKDWVEKLNAFLQFNGKEILHSKREMRKNKKMNEDKKSCASTSINWLISI